MHFLASLEKRPAAPDHAPVYRDWKLPAAFVAFRRELEERRGRQTGTRHFVRILQLLSRHPLTRLEAALLGCQSRGAWDAQEVVAQAERLAREESTVSDNAMSLLRTDALAPAESLLAVRVPPPDLSRFNRLPSPVFQGGSSHDRTDESAPAQQSQTAQAADPAR